MMGIWLGECVGAYNVIIRGNIVVDGGPGRANALVRKHAEGGGICKPALLGGLDAVLTRV